MKTYIECDEVKEGMRGRGEEGGGGGGGGGGGNISRDKKCV